MTERVSLQRVIRACLDAGAEGTLSPRQWQVCAHIRACRTEAMGGLELECDHCGHRPEHFFSCRDRHCPHCQFRATDDWCARQRAAVLPVTYY